MGHCADKLTGRFAWQLGVGVERDDIFYVRQDGRPADDFGKQSRVPPRNRALNSMSFPRLRS